MTHSPVVHISSILELIHLVKVGRTSSILCCGRSRILVRESRGMTFKLSCFGFPFCSRDCSLARERSAACQDLVLKQTPYVWLSTLRDLREVCKWEHVSVHKAVAKTLPLPIYCTHLHMEEISSGTGLFNLSGNSVFLNCWSSKIQTEYKVQTFSSEFTHLSDWPWDRVDAFEAFLKEML